MNYKSQKLSSPVTAPFGYVALRSGSRKAKISAPRTPEKLELGKLIQLTVASKPLLPEFHRIFDFVFHYVSYIVVKLRVYGVPFASTSCCNSTGNNLICKELKPLQ